MDDPPSRPSSHDGYVILFDHNSYAPDRELRNVLQESFGRVLSCVTSGGHARVRFAEHADAEKIVKAGFDQKWSAAIVYRSSI